jgi:hypothetical protein
MTAGSSDEDDERHPGLYALQIVTRRDDDHEFKEGTT